MDIDAPLQDWEISRLSERMSPDEFGRFALGDLGITKVNKNAFQYDAYMRYAVAILGRGGVSA